MGDTVATDTDTVLATTTDTTARGPLRPSPPPLLRPRLMLIPTTDTTAWATMVLDTVPTDTVSDSTDTPVWATTDMVLATTAMDTDTVLDTTVLDTAPTDTVLATTATATVCTDTTDKCPADSRQLRNYIKFK